MLRTANFHRCPNVQQFRHKHDRSDGIHRAAYAHGENRQSGSRRKLVVLQSRRVALRVCRRSVALEFGLGVATAFRPSCSGEQARGKSEIHILLGFPEPPTTFSQETQATGSRVDRKFEFPGPA